MKEVSVSVEAGVAVMTLCAPGRRNALTPSMTAELVAACEAIDADPSVGAVVVRGEGGYFCAGAHREILAEVGVDPLGEPGHGNLTLIYRSFARVGELQAPVIAAVRGAAVGAGVNLALAADLRVVAENARFLPGFQKIGLHPGGGYFVLSGRTAGREATAAMSLFGEEVDGKRAVALGLAWDALPDERVEDRALELARRAAADPELSRRTVRSFRNELGPPTVPWPLAVDAERSAQMWSLHRRRSS